MDEWIPVCGEPMVVWTGTMFGQCFATLVFSYTGHFAAIAITSFYLGRFPKSTSVREPFELPKHLSYALQIILTLLICDPLIKLVVVIFVSGKQNSFVEDFKLMLMFTTWALNLTYYRRLAISNYVKLPGIVPIAASCAALFFCQIPVLLSTADVHDNLNLGFLIAYQFLMLLAIIGYIALFFYVKRKLFRTWPYNSMGDVAISGSRNATPAKPLVQASDGTPSASYGTTPAKSGFENPGIVSE